MSANLNKALSIAQGQFKHITFNCTARVRMKAGGEYSFSYADLNAITEATRPGLVANGLSLSSRTSDGLIHMELRHESGEMITSSLPIHISERPQELGSLLTYYRRYLICGLLGVCADADDDGNIAEGNQADIEKKQAKEPKPAPKAAVIAEIAKPKAATKPKFEPPAGVKDRLLEQAKKSKQPFGKDQYKGMELEKIPSDKLLAAKKWAESVNKFLDFIAAADLILADREKEGDLDLAMGGSPSNEDDMPAPPDWMNEPMPEF